MKNKALFKITAVVLSMFLSSCDLLSNLNMPNRRRSSKSSEEDIVESYKEDSSKQSSSKSSSSKHTHTYTEWTTTKEATCLQNGEKVRYCTVCGQEQKNTIPMIDHQWGDWQVITEPTCVDYGLYYTKCAICGTEKTEDIPPFGHYYDENNVEWTVEPTCTQDGYGETTCLRCGNITKVEVPALGHDAVLMEYQRPQEGRAEVYVYLCMRCYETSLNFSVSQVTNASKERLYYSTDPNTGEIGARFFGHPIGNDVKVDTETGDVDSDYHDPIYNKEQVGDYFEFVFDLTEAQAKLLSNCRLYCDAKPYDWMYQNNLDFFASNPSADLWEPGFYIDEDPAHYNEDGSAKKIEGYRYALYVDDVFQEFDDTILNPVPSGNPRGEYVLPYNFHLHSGTNSFRLHMAGGYKSTFFNFKFKSIDNINPNNISWPNEYPTPIDTSSWTVSASKVNGASKIFNQLQSNNGKHGVKISINDYSSGSIESGKLPNTSGNGITYQIRADKAGLYQLIMKAKTSASGAGRTFSNRGIVVKVNGLENLANIYSDRTDTDAGLETGEYREFVFALVYLSGADDTVFIQNTYYRFVFDTTSDVIFAEI